jgi:hypothetical protein
MTKKEMAELLLAASSGGDNVAPKTTYAEMFKYIDLAIGEVLGIEYKSRYWDLGEKSVNGSWVTTFPRLPVFEDAQRHDHYINLPAQLIALEQNRGVQVVCKMGDEASPYNIIGPSDVAVMMNLECGSYPGQQYCYPESNRIRLIDLGPQAAACLHMVKMVCGTGGLEENRVIPVSAEMEPAIFRAAQALMEQEDKTPQKKSNDGNPNTI